MFGGGADYEKRRNGLVDRLGERVDDEATLAALRAVPRHVFVPERRRDRAYEDHPLPIGDDQTISAPHMVAIMTDLLDLNPGDEVLEIGTGCGYHAAVTAEVVGVGNTYSVEYGPELAERARETLAELGYGDVAVRHGDGRDGWPEYAPYDAAYFTCAVPSVPEAVVEQVRDGGRVLAPVGSRRQTLRLLRKTADGVEREDHGGVRFVPLRGGD
jgi:protein-L-isoaspartate(D-aspartate) O-methyltransferase